MSSSGPVAFVLGGGGVQGAREVGMLAALIEAGLQPDLVLGTSVGAINGAVIAARGATSDSVRLLAELWTSVAATQAFSSSVVARAGTLMRSRTHLHSPEPLRRLLEARVPSSFEELVLPFQCVATSIERAAARWFTRGPLLDAVMASTAVPGLFPPVEVAGEHHLDGGLVHSIPVGRAVRLGAKTVYVLHVGRIDQPLSPPTNVLQVGVVAFEIARRHRFVEEMAGLPDDVTVHVLPTGEPRRPPSLAQQLRYRSFSAVPSWMEQARVAARRHLQSGRG